MVAAVPTTGTIPALPPYQPGALPIVGTESFEIVNTASASTAASWRMLVLDAVGKAPSAMGSVNPVSSDLIAFFQKSSGLYFSSTIGNLGIPTGNLPTGGTAGQILDKNSGVNFDAAWISLSALLSASTAITLVGSTTVAISVTPQSIGSTQLGTNVVGSAQFRQSAGLSVVGNAGNSQANVSDITATAGNQLLQTNAGGTGVLWTTFAPGLLPGPFQASSFTANGVVYGNGTSPLGATGAGTAGLFLQGNGSLSAPSFALVNVGAGTNITGVLNVINGGHGTSSLTINGVVYGNGTTSPVGITPAGQTSLPLVANGTLNAPFFALLTVPGGGLGTSLLGTHGVLIGNGAGVITVSAIGTTNFVLSGNTGADPTFQALSGLTLSTLTMTGGLTVLGLGTSGGVAGVGSATISNVRLVSPKTALYTMANTDLATLITYSSANASSFIFPQAATAIGSAFAGGWFVDVQNIATGALILAPIVSLINGGANFTVFKNQGLRVISDGTGNYQTITGGALAVSLNNTAQTFSGGLRLVSFNLGTIATATITLDSGSGPVQRLLSNGAFTVAAPTNEGELDLLVVNSTNAGPVTFSGFSVGSNTGDTYTTTNTQKFILMVRNISAAPTYAWKALQ